MTNNDIPGAQPGLSTASAFTATYSVTIAMNEATRQAMQDRSLVILKAVQLSANVAPSAAPLAWVVLHNVGPLVTVMWAAQYMAYTSYSAIDAGAVIRADNSVSIAPGQTSNVNQAVPGAAMPGGPANAISLVNAGEVRWICGIGQWGQGDPAPLCAFTPVSDRLTLVIPEEKVLLMFTSRFTDVGTVLEHSPSPALLVDVKAMPDRAEISYDVDQGWQWGGQAWAGAYPANASLRPLLISAIPDYSAH